MAYAHLLVYFDFALRPGKSLDRNGVDLTNFMRPQFLFLIAELLQNVVCFEEILSLLREVGFIE